MKISILLLTLIGLVFATCDPGQQSFVAVKQYAYYSSEEYFAVIDVATDTIVVLGDKFVAQNSLQKEYYGCGLPGNYVLYMEDKYTDGWGSSSMYSWVNIYVDNVLILDSTLLPSTVKFQNVTFSTVFDKPYSTEWQYTDVAQTDSTWTSSSFVPSTWSTATGGSFPAHTSITRYYRTQVTYNGDLSTLTVAGLSFLTDSAFILYADGEEIARKRLDTGIITPTTPSTEAHIIDLNELQFGFTLNNVYVSKTTKVLTLAIEIHTFTGEETIDDVFNGGVYFVQREALSTTYSRLTGGSYSCLPDGTNCKYYLAAYRSNYYYTSSSGVPQFIFHLNNRYDYINSYAVGSASTTSYGYPKSFTLYGSQDGGNTWDVIDVQLDITWSSNQVKTFTCFSNKKSYSSYKLGVTESTKTSTGLGYFGITTTTQPYIGDGLVYPEAEYTSTVIDDSYTITPISTGFHDFTVVPAFPAGITINTSTGIITVAPLSGVSGSYTISAINNNGASKSFTIAFTITGCDQPANTYLTLIKTNKSNYSYESFVMYNSNNEEVFASSRYTSTSTITNRMCVPSDTYKFVLSQSAGNGWYSGSKLTVNVIYNGQTTTFAELSCTSGYEYTTYVNTKIELLAGNANWKYGMGVLPSTWNSASYAGEQLSAFNFATTIPSTHKTWLFYNTFNVASKTNYHGFEVHLKSKSGFVLLINGHELYRKNVPEGVLTVDTEATSGGSSVYYNSVTGPMNYLNANSNSITILLLHTSTSTPTDVDFDCYINLLAESSSKLPRYWGISNAGTGGTRSYLFDYDFYYDYSYNPGYLKPLTVDVTYGTYRAEFSNKYCITSSKATSNFDPSDWGVYGKTGNGAWELIHNVTNAYFSGRTVTRCFYMPSVTKAYAGYRIIITENAYHPTTTYGYYMTELDYVLEDTASLVVPPLTLTPSNIVSYVGVPFAEASSSSDVYFNYRIDPPLELPLEIDTSTGSIRGTPDKIIASSTRRITATNHLGQDSSVDITFAVNYCLPPNVLISIDVTSDYYGEQMGFELRDSTNNLVLSKTGVPRSVTSYYPLCVAADRYNLTLTDSGNNGWTTGSMLVKLENSEIIFRGSLGYNQGAASFPLSVGYVLPPLRTTWSYFNSQSAVQSDWKLPGAQITWASSLSENLPLPVATTQYYRSTFTIQEISYYSSYEVSVRTSGGFIAYVNGVEVFRNNLPSGEIDSTTTGISYLDSTIPVGNTVPVQFGSLTSGLNVLAIEVHHNSYMNLTKTEFDSSFSLIGNKSMRLLDLSVEANDDYTDKLIDNNIYTTYHSSVCVGQTIKFIYNNNRREYISSYSFTTGSNCNIKSPTAWTLYASNDNKNWNTIHIVRSVDYTKYNQVNKYDIYASQSYNAFKFEITECDAVALGGDESDSTCLGYNSGTTAGFALASIDMYSTIIENACSSENGYFGALNGTYAYKNCPDYYFGRVTALCINGHFLADESECDVYAPTKIIYSATTIQITSGKYFVDEATVYGAAVTCTTSPSLPDGISINPTTGTISGTSNSVFDYTTYSITCTNKAGSAHTDVFISSGEAERIDTILLILIIVLCVLVVAIIVVIVVNMTRGKNNTKGSVSSSGRKNSTIKGVKV